MSNLLLIFMGLFFIVPAVIYKQYFLALAFVIFGMVFGLVEYAAHYYTGHTVSQQVWDLLKEHQYKGVIVLLGMAAGWACLIIHLAVKFKK